jgi:benzoyl-CoA reductase/2-hydroxyglutaryl-CoA dehydratase subunit BcrC/BadD/HgdB
VRPDENIILLDLPAIANEAAVSFYAKELARLKEALSEWSGRTISHSNIEASIEQYNNLADLFAQLREQLRQGKLPGGSAAMQTLYNAAMIAPFEKSLIRLQQALAEPVSKAPESDGIPVFLFGNVLADPEAFALFESCGARIIEDDLCTGSRLFTSAGNKGEQRSTLPDFPQLVNPPPMCPDI